MAVSKSVRRRVSSALEIRDADLRNRKLSELFETLGQDDLEQVRSAFEHEYTSSLFMREWEHFLKWWMDFAPDDALLYANSDFADDHWEAKHLAASAAAEYWLGKDPEAAAFMLYQIPPSEVRDNTTMALGQALLMEDLDGAIAWGDGNPDPSFRSAALHSIAYGALRRGMHENYEPETIDKVAIWLRKHAAEPYAGDALAHWVHEVVREDSEQAAGWIDWVVDLPLGSARDRALNAFFANASHTSPDILVNWLEKIEGRSAIDEAMAGYIRGTGGQPIDDPDEIALLTKLANNIGDDALRERAFRDISEL